MSEFVAKNQFFIATKDAKAIGKTGLYEKLDKQVVEFFNAISKAVLNGESEDIFAVQWAVSKLDEGERDAIEKGRETRH
jgi:hypothetical protein